MRIRRRPDAVYSDEAGATAVEFALMLPVFILMILGGMETATLGFAVSSLHFAVEDAARCAAVKTTVCTDGIATNAFAIAHYVGPSIALVVSSSGAGCGHTVSAAGTYSLNLIPQMLNIPISATACYP